MWLWDDWLHAAGFYGDGSILLPANLVPTDEGAHVFCCLDPTLLRVHSILLLILSRRDCSPRQVNHISLSADQSCNILKTRWNKLFFSTLPFLAASWVEFCWSEVFTPSCGVKAKRVRLRMSPMTLRKMSIIRNLHRVTWRSYSILRQRSRNQRWQARPLCMSKNHESKIDGFD